MATTSTTRKTATKKKVAPKTDNTQQEVTVLQERVATLENQLQALKLQVAARPAAAAPTSLGVTKEQVIKVFKAMGARDHILTSAGLK